MNFSPHNYQAYAINYIETHPIAAVLLDIKTFSIYQVLPKIIELWGLNVQTDVQSKKTSRN